jgi:nitrite reductase (NADH) large subunit
MQNYLLLISIPKHLIRYIDRFFMFYIQTADRLQRTSVWRDNMEGGLDYLKSVIVDDSLGLAEELEPYGTVIGTYQDEWRTAVENPEVRKRFQTYINAGAMNKLIRIFNLQLNVIKSVH